LSKLTLVRRLYLVALNELKQGWVVLEGFTQMEGVGLVGAWRVRNEHIVLREN